MSESSEKLCGVTCCFTPELLAPALLPTSLGAGLMSAGAAGCMSAGGKRVTHVKINPPVRR